MREIRSKSARFFHYELFRDLSRFGRVTIEPSDILKFIDISGENRIDLKLSRRIRNEFHDKPIIIRWRGERSKGLGVPSERRESADGWRDKRDINALWNNSRTNILYFVESRNGLNESSNRDTNCRFFVSPHPNKF